MAKAVFISNAQSIYDDLPEERYHFPKQYLDRIESTVGDFIIYYESRRNNGRQVYYATAQIKAIKEDLNKPNHYYAEVQNYLEFPNPVPFKENGVYYETSLLNEDGTVNSGRTISAVHKITEEEYQLILQRGFINVLDLNSQRPDVSIQASSSDLSDNIQEEFERPIIQTIVNRPFRDQAFTAAVKTAYNKTCAMTGLCLINGGGRSEVQAAHIRPVAHKGPDSVRNGIALCGTVHWMFDRGLISLNDDYKILKAKAGIPEAIDRMLVPKGSLILPERSDFRPHPHFLKYHREQIFKG